jgi:hypothetical protein
MPPIDPSTGLRPFNFVKRLKEIDLFFERRDKVHQTMRRLAKQFQKAGISYAIAGAMAVNAHGARRTTDDVDFLLTEEGLNRFREGFVGTNYDQVPGRSRRFVDRRMASRSTSSSRGAIPGRGGTRTDLIPGSGRGQRVDRADEGTDPAPIGPTEARRPALLRLRGRRLPDPRPQPG